MSDTTALRDRTIDFVFLNFPLLLQDDRAVEGIVCFIVNEVRRATEEPEDRDAIARMCWEGCPHGND